MSPYFFYSIFVGYRFWRCWASLAVPAQISVPICVRFTAMPTKSLLCVELDLFRDSLMRWRRRMEKDLAWHEAEVAAGRQGPEDWIWIYDKAEAEEQDVDDRIVRNIASRSHYSWVGLGREPDEDEDDDEKHGDVQRDDAGIGTPEENGSAHEEVRKKRRLQ